MEKTVLSFSVPNFFTVGLILIAWFLLFTLGSQAWMKSRAGAASSTAASGY